MRKAWVQLLLMIPIRFGLGVSNDMSLCKSGYGFLKKNSFTMGVDYISNWMKASDNRALTGLMSMRRVCDYK
jgi:hypothetical protein